ncbi:MAG: glycosyltransferase family 4 protein [Weeksellaceae bacterium]
MKILMLTPYLPYPPASGGQIRTFYLLKYLSRNHDITLVSLYKHEKEKKYAKHLQTHCKAIHLCKRPESPWQPANILKAIFSRLPFLIVRNYSKEARSKVEELLANEHFDVIHAETFYIMPHIPPTEIPILLVEQTIEYKVYQHFLSSLPAFLRLPLSIDIHKLKNWENYYWSEADRVATVSEADKIEINRIAPKITPVVIPNGAGDEMFVEKLPKADFINPTVLFVGNFSWLQNVEAAEKLVEKIIPQLSQKIPNLKCIIAGQNSDLKLKHLSHPAVEIRDLAPSDSETVKELYHSATLFIAPIYGPGGTRLKILASLASGLPVVSTRTGIEGLSVEDGKHVLVAQTPDEFVKKTLEILQDKELYMTIQKQAYIHVKKDFSWESIAKKLEKVYRDIIA